MGNESRQVQSSHDGWLMLTDFKVPLADIKSYTAIFAPSTDTTKALNSFAANAKKQSPRETVARYLLSKRIPPSFPLSKSKAHRNPYYDIWAFTCEQISFMGPLSDPSYANPAAAKMSHPILPVLYHHFGCAVPTYEALSIISNLVKDTGADGVIDLGSGNGYWSYMLRSMGIRTTAVDNMISEYRTMWIHDHVKMDGVKFLKQSKKNSGDHDILLMVYPVVAGNFTSKAIKAYNGDSVVIVGTQNGNRFTGFSDCTVEEWFVAQMPGWELFCRVAMPSFAGKDDAMFVWRRKKK
jgi:hypothetical protein